MGIKDDMINRRAENESAQLMETVGVLLAQEVSNNSEIVTLKALVKNEVAADIFNPVAMQSLSGNLSMVQSITDKKARYKTTLTTLHGRVRSVPYKAEIQTVIDTL